MTTLIAGANAVLSNSSISIAINTSLAMGQTVGVVWLALGEDYSAKISPAYLHEQKSWAKCDDGVWTLNLAEVFGQGVKSVQMVIYAYYDPNLAIPATELADIALTVDGNIYYDVPVKERHIKTALVLELYERGGQYKCRALAECTGVNLKAFGEHLGISLYEKFPQETSDTPTQRRPVVGETWTGTAFAIDSHHLLTCHHVIDGASVIGIRQQGRADRQAYVVMSDEGSDTALIRVDEPLSCVLPLAQGQVELLGESVVTMGFPLSGLTSQLQVTSGNISGLLGVRDDIRFLQFTAPIQAGSSGSPLMLATGEVIGMVTSSITNTQNMNYAVKYQLLSALLSSAGVANAHTPHTAMSTPELIRAHKEAVYLVGCRA
ncbi:S1 family peptidase [Moraxella oblonga]|uniref:S1 family peptidase n=1 Tax=Moraxella oblonga TaxID=200413 RepID=UPI000836DBAB|nr:serine protease [Moraxella oblonga]